MEIRWDRAIHSKRADDSESFVSGRKSTVIDGCVGAAIRQPLRPLHVLQSEVTVGCIYVHISDRDGKCNGESG